ncbi:hypothetical protein B484DRAFT_36004 [Ochromonadaceae sp. CCMP2298]|nr:hypothetical protein B484DRAFT_36004 [Ochromonadaceae sp. CCMP2298]
MISYLCLLALAVACAADMVHMETGVARDGVFRGRYAGGQKEHQVVFPGSPCSSSTWTSWRSCSSRSLIPRQLRSSPHPPRGGRSHLEPCWVTGCHHLSARFRGVGGQVHSPSQLEYITAVGRIEQWEELFDTRLYAFRRYRKPHAGGVFRSTQVDRATNFPAGRARPARVRCF